MMKVQKSKDRTFKEVVFMNTIAAALFGWMAVFYFYSFPGDSGFWRTIEGVNFGSVINGSYDVRINSIDLIATSLGLLLWSMGVFSFVLLVGLILPVRHSLLQKKLELGDLVFCRFAALCRIVLGGGLALNVSLCLVAALSFYAFKLLLEGGGQLDRGDEINIIISVAKNLQRASDYIEKGSWLLCCICLLYSLVSQYLFIFEVGVFLDSKRAARKS